MPTSGAPILHVALFVDFDNVFLTLCESDREAANLFAANPGRWLDWLATQMSRVHPTLQGHLCRIAVRRCYLNPNSFADKRPFFIRSGFEIVDCPPLTSKGKTAADIHIVMDVLDTLNAAPHYDAFVILSADSDFTPVLLRLRTHQRFTAMLAVGMVSPAYRAASDLVITQDEFIRDGLGLTPLEEDETAYLPIQTPADTALLDRMAARLAEAAEAPGGIVAHELAGVYKEFPEFRASQHWLGFHSLFNLTRELLNRRPELTLVNEDPWRVVRADTFASATEEPVAPPALPPVSDNPAEWDELRAAIAEWVITTVRNSPHPVPTAVLEVQLNTRHALEGTHWLGYFTFEGLLPHLVLDGLQYSPVPPGYLYDPAQHTPPREDEPAGASRRAGRMARKDRFAESDPMLAEFAGTIHQLTDAPYLRPEDYGVLFRVLADEVNANGYQLTRTSRVVRDRCVEQGAPVARSQVNFVLTGLAYQGHRFSPGEERPAVLAEEMARNVIGLCHTAQYTLTPEDEARIVAWITGGVGSPTPEEDSAPSDAN